MGHWATDGTFGRMGAYAKEMQDEVRAVGARVLAIPMQGKVQKRWLLQFVVKGPWFKGKLAGWIARWLER